MAVHGESSAEIFGLEIDASAATPKQSCHLIYKLYHKMGVGWNFNPWNWDTTNIDGQQASTKRKSYLCPVLGLHPIKTCDAIRISDRYPYTLILRLQQDCLESEWVNYAATETVLNVNT